MRTAKWSSRDESVPGVEQSANAVHLGGLDRLPQREWWQDGRYPFGNHRFPGSRWSNTKNIMSAGSGDLNRSFHVLLTLDLAEIEVLFIGSEIGPTVSRADRIQFDISAQKMNDLRKRT